MPGTIEKLVKQWEGKTPEERRARLDELGANENRDEVEDDEHNVLAALVAVDEDEARNEVAKKPVESQDV